MMVLTLRIVAEALFGAEVEPVARDVDRALGVALHVTNDRVKTVLDVPAWLPTPANLRFRRAMSVLDGVVLGLIRERRRGEPRDDLLSMLMEARDPETGQGMSDRQLRDEVMGVFLAGHETTVNALTWTLYLLSQHPDEEARLHAEVARVPGDRPPTPEDARQLPLTTMVIQESMRLFPPAWLFGRSPAEDEEIDGFSIPAGSLVFLSPYVTHPHRAVAGPRAVLPGPLRPREDGDARPLRVLPFRRRSADLHRRALRQPRAAGRAGQPRAAFPAAPGPGRTRGARAPRDAPAALRDADAPRAAPGAEESGAGARG